MSIKNSKTLQSNQPDLAIIRKDYKEWYIVEVELSTHRFKHIEEQVDTFTNGIYNNSHAEELYKKDTARLVKPSLETMVSKFAPKVMVIVNDKNCNWIDKLKPYKCKIGIFQIYFDKEQKRIYRFNGHFPLMRHDFGTCRFISGVALMVQLIEFDFLDGLGIADGEIIQGSYNGKSTEWKRINSGKQVYLECLDRVIPLDPSTHRYVVVYDENEKVFEFYKA